MNFFLNKIEKYLKGGFMTETKCFDAEYYKNSLKNKTNLKAAEKSDQKGNYGLDGASFDGQHIYINGKRRSF